MKLRGQKASKNSSTQIFAANKLIQADTVRLRLAYFLTRLCSLKQNCDIDFLYKHVVYWPGGSYRIFTQGLRNMACTLALFLSPMENIFLCYLTENGLEHIFLFCVILKN